MVLFIKYPSVQPERTNYFAAETGRTLVEYKSRTINKNKIRFKMNIFFRAISHWSLFLLFFYTFFVYFGFCKKYYNMIFVSQFYLFLSNTSVLNDNFKRYRKIGVVKYSYNNRIFTENEFYYPYWQTSHLIENSDHSRSWTKWKWGC